MVVFGYHRFEKKVRRPDTEITPEAFEAQMKELQDQKVAVIGMQDFLAWKRGEKAIPPDAAIITIDDGYKSGYEVAWPILKKFKYPFTLFIYTEGIKGGKFGGGEAMSWEQLAEMRDAGVDIQAHSATHQDLRKPYDKVMKHKLSPEEYTAWLNAEVGGSKVTLEHKLGIRVNCFAVPFGYYNDRVKEATKQAGYEAVYRLRPEADLRLTERSLGRYMIEQQTESVRDAISLRILMGERPGREIPLSINPSRPTVQTASFKPLIEANLGAIGGIEPGSVKMRVSGLGLVAATYDPARKMISYQVTQPLHGDSCSVIIEAKIGEKKAEAHWKFTLKESAVKAKAAPASAVSPAATPKK